MDKLTEKNIEFNALDFVFAQFNGIFLTSLVYFLLYCMYKSLRNQAPQLHARTILPAFVSGAIWAVANISWFIANDSLGFSVSFPIITSTPGLIGALWGVTVYGEIKGKKNLLTLAGAFCLTVTAVLMIAFSRGS